jgi:hypothetical protein
LYPFPLGFPAYKGAPHTASDKTACDDDYGRGEYNPTAPLDVWDKKENIHQECEQGH